VRLNFWNGVQQLERYYGPPSAPALRDPFELILYENIAYLVSDDRREKAFRELKKRVGSRPADVLTAPLAQLAQITAMGGIFPELRARRLQESARLVRDDFGGSLLGTLALDPAKARKALQKFPAIGGPGADKILFFTGTVATLAPESNALRVLVRLGLVEDHKNYSTTYRAAGKALQAEYGEECAPLIAAHLLLRRHGQELCRRSAPRCESCPLRKACPSASGLSRPVSK
jgi:endonuclease-3